MRRVALIAFALIVLFVPDRRPTKALPMNGIERYYYANACWMTSYCRMVAPGQPGSYLGYRVAGCYEQGNSISETDLSGNDNWKQEIVQDCTTGYYTVTWYHGGYHNWTASGFQSNCYCDY